MTKSNWKFFHRCELVCKIFLICNLIFIIINDELLKSKFPEFIQGYLFFFSLGLYIGFIFCKNEYRRVLKKMYPDQEKNSTKNIHVRN